MEWVGLIISLLALAWIFIQQKAGGIRESEADKEELSESVQAIPQSRASRSARRSPSFPSSSVVVSNGVVTPPAQREGHHSTREREKRRSTKSVGDRRGKPAPSFHERNAEAPTVRVTSPVERAVKRLAHHRDLIIYQEIIGPPKSFRLEP